MDQRKKDNEEWLLKKFISNHSLGKVVTSIDPDETPDFKIKTLESTISIELTRVINPNIKQNESVQARIVNQAFKKFKQQRKELLRVYVEFTSMPMEFKVEFIQKLADELAEFVLDICTKNENLEFHVATKKYQRFHEYFQRISISNELNFENWQPFGAHLVPFIDEAWFKERIIDN